MMRIRIHFDFSLIKVKVKRYFHIELKDCLCCRGPKKHNGTSYYVMENKEKHK